VLFPLPTLSILLQTQKPIAVLPETINVVAMNNHIDFRTLIDPFSWKVIKLVLKKAVVRLSGRYKTVMSVAIRIRVDSNNAWLAIFVLRSLSIEALAVNESRELVCIRIASLCR
jgi:hypothetical protein